MNFLSKIFGMDNSTSKDEKGTQTNKKYLDIKNAQPETKVPVTGKYKCCYCGEGGMMDFMAKELGAPGASGLGPMFNTSKMQNIAGKNTIEYFEEGSTFSECPTCGPATGWDFLE